MFYNFKNYHLIWNAIIELCFRWRNVNLLSYWFENYHIVQNETVELCFSSKMEKCKVIVLLV